jgi:hypothetical protein
MAITREDVMSAERGDSFLDRTGMHWDILDRWSGAVGTFFFELRFPNYKPIRVSYNEDENVFRIVGETPFALDDLNHPKAKLEKKT